MKRKEKPVKRPVGCVTQFPHIRPDPGPLTMGQLADKAEASRKPPPVTVRVRIDGVWP